MEQSSTVNLMGYRLKFIEQVFIEDLIEKFGVFDGSLLPQRAEFDELRSFDLGLVENIDIQEGIVNILVVEPVNLINDLIEFTGLRNIMPFGELQPKYVENVIGYKMLEDSIVFLSEQESMSGFKWR